ncbi:helix-turn-helix domain-containing protein [Clostridium sp. FP2]|nr:helix-turn-helix domain-containing protein [Clostridium sp. FP2]MBZ9626205.1 helix-turn-helix domain-containing protein [Clostridium sp. FP2]
MKNKILRAEKEITQEGLAKAMGVSRGTILEIENAIQKLTYVTQY